VWSDLYDNLPGQRETSKAFRYAVGDCVRLTRRKGVFGRGYVQQWTKELFLVVDRKFVQVPTYTVKDLFGNVIRGFFYESEVQKVSKA
jgi:hypothetical protein